MRGGGWRGVPRRAGEIRRVRHPVDSEHNAIFQVLGSGDAGEVDVVTITASGGPFREWPLERMATATVEEAVAHPNWAMGRKISLDSATLMNKGLELIEAHFLFALPPDKLERAGPSPVDRALPGEL